MKLVADIAGGTVTGRPVFLVCVFRDEHLPLAYFIEYYRRLGVTHFIMVDNASIDAGPAWLADLTDINLLLYRTEESYRDAAFGTRWINQLLREHCVGHYCFAVDVDELFVPDPRRYANLDAMMDAMESAHSNVVPAVLLDMYPERTNDRYRRGRSFLEHSPYYDAFNETHYELRDPVYRSFRFMVGGVRHRVFGVKPCVQKMPFFRYDFQPLGLSQGCHFFQHEGETRLESDLIRLHPEPGLLLHFKFIKPRIHSFVRQRIERNQDWNESSEYRAYREALEASDDGLRFFDARYSRRARSMEAVFASLEPLLRSAPEPESSP